MSKHNGNFEVYGDLVVGANISGSKYILPHEKGDTGESLIMDSGALIFANPAPYIDIAQTSGGAILVENVNQLMSSILDISGTVDNFIELFDTPKPASSIDTHEGEIIIVDPNASAQVQKIAYSGVSIDDVVTALESSGQSIIITPIIGGYNLDIAVPLDITSFTGGSVYEIGTTVSSVSLNWAYNRTVTSQSINQGIGSLPVVDRSYVYNTPITTNTTFTLSAAAGVSTDTGSTSVTFLSRRFWGVTTSGSMLLENDIELGSNELSGTKTKSITFDCTGGRRIFYAYPVSYGLATVKDANGFIFNDFLTGTGPYTVSITNSLGYNQNYYVYHTFNLYNSATVQFSWS